MMGILALSQFPNPLAQTAKIPYNINPMDTMQKAVRTGKIAIGDEPNKPETQRHKGGKARAEKLSAEEKREIGKKGAKARWKKD